jgi:branched-chain amino acid aminotransferase
MSETQVAASAASTARDDSWVWFNGDFARYRDAKLGVMTHALHYGTGCFEGIRA